MICDILISAVGGQDVKPYLDFFHKIASKTNTNIFVDYKSGFSKERCSERYSIRIGGGYGEILEGKADAVISLEQLEAVKCRFYPKESGGLIVSKKRILPASVINGTTEYPKDCMQKCVNDCFKVFETDGEDYLLNCCLSLRLIGLSEDETLKLVDDYPISSQTVKQAYAQKFVKA